jgi:hypothetical protein
MGQDNTQKMVILRGNFVENDTSTQYSVGGIGSTSFEVTAFSAVGLVTYTALKGQQLVNGQRVVIYNTSSNTNDGTYVVSVLTPNTSTPLTAGTFVAVPIGLNVLAGSAQTTQTAEGVGQIQFGNKSGISQTFTATAVTVSGGISTITYTTLVGPQLWPGQSVLIAGMTNTGNNGTFSIVQSAPTSSTAGSFTVTNSSGVATDSGTGTGSFIPGSDVATLVPVQVNIFTSKGWSYLWDSTNYTIRIFTTGTSSGSIANEAALGASVAYDGTITYEAIFVRSKYY